ncbi:DUF1232 domain-containing protein [Lysobacter sp. GCM10012299]|uniref:DUF1232 domain-containing protein n=1 Tax=Lysobacter sp. GCM10012299 TaxID=3317333 RepID=UPI00360A7B22
MSLTLTIDFSDEDLERFTGQIEAAKKDAEGKSNEEIVAAATVLLEKAQQGNPPIFVKQRLPALGTLIAMLRDEAWALSDEDSLRVRAALNYLAAPIDIIPDDIPVFGFLDDAVMIELCARKLSHEIEAYDDFCEFREREAERRGLQPETVGRADWLQGRRDELQERMHRRRGRESGRGFGQGYGSSSGYGSPVSRYTDNSWRPGPFKFR